MFSVVTSVINICLLLVIMYLTVKSGMKVKDLEARLSKLEENK